MRIGLRVLPHDLEKCRAVCLVGLLWLGVGAVVGSACSGSAEDIERTGGQGSGARDDENAAMIVMYSDEEIGVETFVDSYLAEIHPFVHHRTVEEHDDEMLADWDDFLFLPVERRDRLFFEEEVFLVLWTAKQARPAEIERIETLLFDAFYDSLDVCAERSEYPDIQLYLEEDGEYYPVWPEEEAQRHSITVDEFLDLRHECSKSSASYPVLDREYRDELLKARRDYYLKILRLWLADHPELVVPLDYENSVNQPYQDYVREVCTAEAEDPGACAGEVGVTFP